MVLPHSQKVFSVFLATEVKHGGFTEMHPHFVILFGCRKGLGKLMVILTAFRLNSHGCFQQRNRAGVIASGQFLGAFVERLFSRRRDGLTGLLTADSRAENGQAKNWH